MSRAPRPAGRSPLRACAAVVLAIPLAGLAAPPGDAALASAAASALLSPVRQFQHVAGIDDSGWQLRGESNTTLTRFTPDASINLEVVTHPGRPRAGGTAPSRTTRCRSCAR